MGIWHLFWFARMIALLVDKRVESVHPDPLEGVSGLDLPVALAVTRLPPGTAEARGVPPGGGVAALARDLHHRVVSNHLRLDSGCNEVSLIRAQFFFAGF